MTQRDIHADSSRITETKYINRIKQIKLKVKFFIFFKLDKRTDPSLVSQETEISVILVNTPTYVGNIMVRFQSLAPKKKQ